MHMHVDTSTRKLDNWSLSDQHLHSRNAVICAWYNYYVTVIHGATLDRISLVATPLGGQEHQTARPFST